MTDSETERLKETIAQLREQLREASHHVYRQQKHGKHEQDRADAVEWMKQWEKQ